MGQFLPSGSFSSICCQAIRLAVMPQVDERRVDLPAEATRIGAGIPLAQAALLLDGEHAGCQQALIRGVRGIPDAARLPIDDPFLFEPQHGLKEVVLE